MRKDTTMTARELGEFRNFSVQTKTTNGWENELLYVSYQKAVDRSAVLILPTRIFGHHKTARGGFGDRIVLESKR
jgi:hypothetical protein